MNVTDNDAPKGYEEWRNDRLTLVDGELKRMVKTMSGIRNIGITEDLLQDMWEEARKPLLIGNEKLNKDIEEMKKDMLHLYKDLRANCDSDYQEVHEAKEILKKWGIL